MKDSELEEFIKKYNNLDPNEMPKFGPRTSRISNFLKKLRRIVETIYAKLYWLFHKSE